jgi:hypothetical protein
MPSPQTRPPDLGAGPADGLGPVPAANQPGHQPAWPQDKPAPRRRSADAGAVEAPGEGRHPFLFEPLLLPFAAAAGVTPWTTGVDIDGGSLRIRFGPWSLETPLDNVVGATVTGPYRLHRVAGPPHLSLRDRGVTFATNRQQGTCIHFDRSVPALLPGGLLRHPAATVTVADPVALAAALDRT